VFDRLADVKADPAMSQGKLGAMASSRGFGAIPTVWGLEISRLII
jgi:hypothetical protein